MPSINKRRQRSVKIRGTKYKTKFRPVNEKEASTIRSSNLSMHEPMFDFADGITTVEAFTDNGENYVFEVPTLEDGRIPSSVALMRPNRRTLRVNFKTK